GMGLGLTVARRVAKALDGGVRLERTGRDGSVFVATFDLPRAERVVRLVPSPARRPGVHALVVDDDPVQQVIARSFLQSLGVTCDVVGSGVAACAAFDPARHDVVLLDVHMPGMSGLEVFDVLRARPDGGAVHVVALTADPGAAVAHGGFDDVLAKPTRVDDLRRALAPVFPVDFELAKAC
ncbi:MAG TPA: response regulator, partial [Myxococcota bacterium]|nr:response regulator [Myxococcota bacterium]